MMKHKVVIAALAAGLVGGVIGAKLFVPSGIAAVTKAESNFEHVLRTQTLRCGYATWQPYLYRSPQGQLVGINYDIMEALGRELNLKVEWTEEVDWGSIGEGMKTGRYDMVCSSIWPDDARIKNFTLTTPIFYSPVYAYVRAGDHRFDGNLQKLNDPSVKLAAIDGDQTYISARIDFPKAQVYALPQNASGSDQFLAVMTGKADAAILDAGGYNMFAKENPGKLVRVAGVKAERTYGERLAVKQGDYLLRDMLNVGIDVLLDNGVIQKIVQGYTNTYYMPENHYTAHE